MHSFQEFFSQSFQWGGLVNLLIQVAAVLLCLTVHETCHGLAALALGDPTAKSQHRLSLNPLRHLDFFGTLMMLVAGFGWAKPVMVNPSYFKNPKSGMALTALAGPVSNFLLALLALLVRGFVLVPYTLTGGSTAVGYVIQFLETLAVLSVGLGLLISFHSRRWTAPRWQRPFFPTAFTFRFCGMSGGAWWCWCCCSGRACWTRL